MDYKIWYKFTPSNTYLFLDNVYNISFDSTEKREELIKECIKIFNDTMVWDCMWTLEQALERIENGGELFIYAPNQHPKGFIWSKDNYLYNLFVSPEIRNLGIAEKLMKHCFTNLPYTIFYSYVDSWNKVAQNLVENKIGGIKLYSYI